MRTDRRWEGECVAPSWDPKTRNTVSQRAPRQLPPGAGLLLASCLSARPLLRRSPVRHFILIFVVPAPPDAMHKELAVQIHHRRLP